jgi:2-oxoglutarate ferredoxin oxidoreductase subunit alpha
LVKKIRNFADSIVEVQESQTDDAEVIIISYGAASRAALKAMEQARKSGLKVGSLKLVTVWPFPEKRVAELAKKVKSFVVPEMNFGQIVLEVERCSYGSANVFSVYHGEKGAEHTDDILSAIKQAVQSTNIANGIIEYKGT